MICIVFKRLYLNMTYPTAYKFSAIWNNFLCTLNIIVRGKKMRLGRFKMCLHFFLFIDGVYIYLTLPKRYFGQPLQNFQVTKRWYNGPCLLSLPPGSNKDAFECLALEAAAIYLIFKQSDNNHFNWTSIGFTLLWKYTAMIPYPTSFCTMDQRDGPTLYLKIILKPLTPHLFCFFVNV